MSLVALKPHINKEIIWCVRHEIPFVFEHPECVVLVKDSDVVMLDEEIRATAIFTPGHNPSCITWIVGDYLFTGDSYIPGIKIVTNLPGGNKKDAVESIENIKNYAIGREIFPGHFVN